VIEASHVAHILTDHYGIDAEVVEDVSGLFAILAGPLRDGHRAARIWPWYGQDVSEARRSGGAGLVILPDLEPDELGRLGLEPVYVRDLLPAGLDWQHVQAGDVAGAIAAWIETR